MSLLMDALKRAERARQEEDARRKAEGGDSVENTGGMSMDAPELSLEEMSTDDGLDVGEATLASAADNDDVDPLADLPEFSKRANDTIGLSDSAEMRAVEEEILAGRASLDANLEDTAEWELGELQNAAEGEDLRSSASLSVDYNEIPLEETSSTLPSMRSARRSVDDYFDGTQSVSMSAEQSADVTGSRAADTTDQRFVDTTRRTAKALLEDGAPGHGRSSATIAALVLIPLLLLVLGGAGYLFKDDLMALIWGDSQRVARRPPVIPTPPPAAETTAAAPTPAAAEPTLSASDTAADTVPPVAAVIPMPATVPPTESEQAAFVAAARALEGSAESPSPSEVVTGQIDTGVPARVPATAADPVAVSGASGAQSTPESAMPAQEAMPTQEDIDVAQVLDAMPVGETQTMASVDLPSALAAAGGGTGGLRITRRRGPGPTQRRLVRAYEAFTAGDDGTAATLYQRILSRRPDNRDALLGMAAIFMRGGAEDQAERAYARVLRRNPRDSAALSGLLALRQSADPVSAESQLKSMLAEQPSDPQLHFTLGNTFAKQRRWAEAQSAYFEAFRLSSDNPDYAFNLAVALDQLRQRKAAAQYYRRAVELGESRSTAFDKTAAQVRADALERAG